MKPTIRNKVMGGFAGVLTLMAVLAVVSGYAVFSLRHSANQATRVGARLNSIAIEIQVHNLEAQRRVKSYMALAPSSENQQKREMYLEEATFEIHEIQSLVEKATEIAPTASLRTQFQRIAGAATDYQGALNNVVEADKQGSSSPQAQQANATYEDIAEQLHESAEDGELAGKDASQSSLEEIDRTSKRSVTAVIGISWLALALCVVVSYKLAQAILVPIDHLKNVAENVSLGNLDIAVHRYSDDEIGDLADSFSRMVTAVKFFRLEAADANKAIKATAVGKGGAQ
jgi:nitrogen fixation/metabolism regulation signal transduction histidine kinase